MNKARMSAPWVLYYREINELFNPDPNVRVEYDDKEKTITLYVEGQEKATAITHILPQKKTYGNVTLTIRIVPSNKNMNEEDYIAKAFEGNPVFSYIYKVPIEVTQSNPMTYVAFQNKVVQYYGDNLHDPHGNVSTLYEIIARDVIGESDGVFFCTDRPKNSGVAVG